MRIIIPIIIIIASTVFRDNPIAKNELTKGLSGKQFKLRIETALASMTKLKFLNWSRITNIMFTDSLVIF
jgi:hypothetical protein